jgi:hypothetical protein
MIRRIAQNPVYTSEKDMEKSKSLPEQLALLLRHLLTILIAITPNLINSNPLESRQCVIQSLRDAEFFK